MSRADALHRLAGASSLMVRESDLAGVLVRVIAEATAATDATAGGLLILNGDCELELLSATSHRAGDLEAWQAATGVGPCSACIDQVAPISATLDEAGETWPDFAAEMARAGYQYVLATPLRWHGRALGGLNLFWDGTPRYDEAPLVAQAFADALTLAVLAIRPVPDEETRSRLDEALRGRVVIEQAKGVLAHQDELSLAEAFDRLLELCDERGEPLGAMAQYVVQQAHEGGADG